VPFIGFAPAVALAASLAWAVEAPAQSLQNRPVRIVVPTAPGGTLDLLTRVMAPKLGEAWGATVVVDNRAGASGIIGYEAVANANPDGHTMAMVGSTFSVTAAVYRKLPFDALRDFVPVSLVAYAPWGLIVNAALPVRTVKELVALTKERSGQINYASTGTGGATHLAVELFKSMTGAQMTHVPYKGTAPALNDVIGGQVQLMITGITTAMPHVATGKLRVLAVTGKNRVPSLPDVPTIAESVPGYEYNNWFGALAPRAAPVSVVAQLHRGIEQALKAKEVRQTLVAQGLEPVGSSPAQFRDVLRQEIARYSKLASSIGVQLD
jgi:tripartite-type tricarboxylate transporter receptor subunit TctC